MPLMRDVGRNGKRLHELTERLVRMEGRGTKFTPRGSNAASPNFDKSSIDFAVRREIFKHLERIIDSFEDVANQIDSIVIDHS